MASGNDYVIQVKRNQKSLYNEVVQIAAQTKPVDNCLTQDSKRGRIENRDVSIYKAVKSSEVLSQWTKIQTIIKVTNHGCRKDIPYRQEHYYISSKSCSDAMQFAKGIRSHWGVENRLHWVKDVIFNEDHCRIRNASIALNLSLIKSAVINLYRSNGMNSIKMAIEKHSNKIPNCLKLINDYHI